MAIDRADDRQHRGDDAVARSARTAARTASRTMPMSTAMAAIRSSAERVVDHERDREDQDRGDGRGDRARRRLVRAARARRSSPRAPGTIEEIRRAGKRQRQRDPDHVPHDGDAVEHRPRLSSRRWNSAAREEAPPRFRSATSPAIDSHGRATKFMSVAAQARQPATCRRRRAPRTAIAANAASTPNVIARGGVFRAAMIEQRAGWRWRSRASIPAATRPERMRGRRSTWRRSCCARRDRRSPSARSVASALSP